MMKRVLNILCLVGIFFFGQSTAIQCMHVFPTNLQRMRAKISLADRHRGAYCICIGPACVCTISQTPRWLTYGAHRESLINGVQLILLSADNAHNSLLTVAYRSILGRREREGEGEGKRAREKERGRENC